MSSLLVGYWGFWSFILDFHAAGLADSDVEFSVEVSVLATYTAAGFVDRPLKLRLSQLRKESLIVEHY